MIIESTTYKQYIEAAILGASRCNLGLLLEHPFETIKTQWQKKNKVNSVVGITNLIYKERGIGGFYKGLAPNLLKTSCKNLFRWPAMIYLPDYFKSLIQTSPFYFDSLPKVLTGLVISNVEVFGFNPLERIKVALMTEKMSLSTFFSKHQGNLINELFKGLGPSFWKTNVSWMTFILSDHYLKRLWKEGFEKKILSGFDLLAIPGLVGLASTLTAMPFDFLKTQAQLETEKIQQRSTMRALSDHFSKSGIKMLYTGWNLRFSQTMINSAIAVHLLEKFETDYKNRGFVFSKKGASPNH